MTPRALFWGASALARPEPRRREAVLARQLACIRDLTAHAYRSVPYYRELMDRAGVRPRDVRTLDDFAAIPVTTREDLQFLKPEEICSRDYRIERLREITTGGSTGAPLTVRRTMTEERLLLGFRSRATAALGFGPRMRLLAIDHLNPKRAYEHGVQFHQRLGLLPRRSIDWRRPKEEILRAWKSSGRTWSSVRPRSWTGWPSRSTKRTGSAFVSAAS